MANNYEEAATIVSAQALAPGAAKRIQEIFLQMEEEGMDTNEWTGGLQVEAQPDGALYIASDDEWFSYDTFTTLMEKAAEEQLLLHSFGISVAWYCSKLRPDEFGGAYHRVLPTGEVLSISTCLSEKSDEEIRALASTFEA